MDHTIDALLHTEECAVRSEVANLSLDGGSDGILLLKLFPWVDLKLTHTEGNLLLLNADAENNGFDLLIEFKHIAGSVDTLDP